MSARADPLRIAVLAHVRHPIRPPFAGGMEAHTWHLARGLAVRGHDVTLYASADSDAGVPLSPTVPEHYERRLPWAHHRDGATLRTHLRAVFARAADRFRDGDHDVVHNNTLHPLPMERARRDAVPMLTSLHVPPFEALRRAVDANVAAGTRVTVTSARQRTIWWGETPPSGAHVVHNGIDLSHWPYRPEAGDGSAIWAGRITPTKGVHLAAEAARLVGRRLAIIGPIEDRGYFDERVRPLLDERVRHVGHLDGPALAASFGRASVLLFTPLWEEPFGLVAIEAMACGLPVAYLGRGAADEIVGAAGVRADGERAAALGDAMERAVAIPRAVPRRRVEERFTLERMLDGYERLYRDCIAGASARAPSVRPEPATAVS